MNRRRRILLALYQLYKLKGPNNYAAPETIPGFRLTENWRAALERLIQEQLVHSVGFPLEGANRLGVALNPEKLEDVQKELAVWYKDARIMVPVIIAALALLWAIVERLVL